MPRIFEFSKEEIEVLAFVIEGEIKKIKESFWYNFFESDQKRVGILESILKSFKGEKK